MIRTRRLTGTAIAIAFVAGACSGGADHAGTGAASTNPRPSTTTATATTTARPAGDLIALHAIRSPAGRAVVVAVAVVVEGLGFVDRKSVV